MREPSVIFSPRPGSAGRGAGGEGFFDRHPTFWPQPDIEMSAKSARIDSYVVQYASASG